MLSKNVCASYLPTFLPVGMRAYTLRMCVYSSLRQAVMNKITVEENELLPL